MNRKEANDLIRNAEGFNYISRPGDGKVRYVFDGKVCVGQTEALEYVRR